MSSISAGLLLYRLRGRELEVLLVHPGGPYFRRKDLGAWTIPKGEAEPNEPLLDVARREFREETGLDLEGPFVELRAVRQKGGKLVHAWAVAGDCDPATLQSNTFSLEWPPRSGRHVDFPEVDRAEFFSLAKAREKINPAQVTLLDDLAQRLTEG